MFRATKRVNVLDIFDMCASSSQVKSSLGPLSERCWNAVLPPSGTDEEEHHAQLMAVAATQQFYHDHDVEQNILNNANLYTCVAALAKQSRVPWASTDVLHKFARRNRMYAGAVAIRVARAYEPWRHDVDEKRPAGTDPVGVLRGDERGAAEVYRWMAETDRSLPVISTDLLYQRGECKEAKFKANVLVADTKIVIAGWADLWNRQAGFVDWLSATEFALKYNVPLSTVQRWCKEGKLPAVLERDTYKIDVKDLMDPGPVV